MGSSGSSDAGDGSWIINLVITGGIVILLGLGGYILYTIVEFPLGILKSGEETVKNWWDDIHFFPLADPKTGKPASTGDQIVNGLTWFFPLPKIVYQVVTGEEEKGKFQKNGIPGKTQTGENNSK